MVEIKKSVDFSQVSYNDVLELFPKSIIGNIKLYYTHYSYMNVNKDTQGFIAFLSLILKDESNLIQKQELMALLFAMYMDAEYVESNVGNFVVANREIVFPILQHKDISYSKVNVGSSIEKEEFRKEIPISLMVLDSNDTSLWVSQKSIYDYDIFADVLMQRITQVGIYKNQQMRGLLDTISSTDSEYKELKKEVNKYKRMYSEKDIDAQFTYVFLSSVIFESNIKALQKSYFNYKGEEPQQYSGFSVANLVFYTLNKDWIKYPEVLVSDRANIQSYFSSTFGNRMDFSDISNMVMELKTSSHSANLFATFIDLLDQTGDKDSFIFLSKLIYELKQRKIDVGNLKYNILLSFDTFDNFKGSIDIFKNLGFETAKRHYKTSIINHLLINGKMEREYYASKLLTTMSDIDIDKVSIENTITNKKDSLLIILECVADTIDSISDIGGLMSLIDGLIESFDSIVIQKKLIDFDLEIVSFSIYKNAMLSLLATIYNVAIFTFNKDYLSITKLFENLTAYSNMLDMIDDGSVKQSMAINKMVNGNGHYINDNGEVVVKNDVFLDRNFDILSISKKTK